MAVYQPSTNWDDVNARGGVAGTTQAPATTPYDPNADTTTTDWSRILNGGGVTGGTNPQPQGVDGGPPRTVTNTANDAGIAAAYQKYLGRDVGASEYDYWRNVPNYESGIANSSEARQRSATAPPTSTAPNTSQPSEPPNGMNPDQYAYQKQALINAYWKYLYRLPDQSELDAFAGKSADQFNAHLGSIPTSWESLRAVQQRGGKTNDAAIPSGNASTSTTTTTAGATFTPGSLDWVKQQLAKFKSTDDPNYWLGAMAKDPKVAAGDQSAIDYWLYRMSIGDGAEDVRMGRKQPFDHGSGGGGNTGGYTGATAFSDPATQQWEQLVRQLTERLNNPMPDSAKELQQTQALDPLERQRTTMKQQTAQRLSQRGITPTSGTWEQAMSDIDRQFNELRTRTQAGFANSWAQNEDNRMLQAANLFKQIPQYQDSRLELARNTLIPTNVGSLLNLQQQGNQWDQYQNQAFWQNLAKTIADLMNQ